METRELIVDGVHVVALGGDIDMEVSPDLRQLLAGHTEAQRPALVLDFSEVNYVDSSGLATLIEYVRNAQPFQGKLALANLSERVRTVFELVRLDEFLPIHHTVADATASLAGASPPTA
jgi:anti-sigma B factor antagonist